MKPREQALLLLHKAAQDEALLDEVLTSGADRGSRRDRFPISHCCRLPIARSARGTTDLAPFRNSISQRLGARHVLVTSLVQPGEALETIGIHN